MHCIEFGRTVLRNLLLIVAAGIINVPQAAEAQVDGSARPVVPEELLPSILEQPSQSVPVPPDPTAIVPPENPNNMPDSNDTDSAQLGYSVLMQGPIHEAFAASAYNDPKLGNRVHAEQPPRPIEEKPPANTLAAEGAIWIPGYWAWSDEANKYVWVSGLYRKPPPGRSWKAGYWSQSGSGYRWTSGYWSNAQVLEVVEALPVPPSSIDNGPSAPPPSDNHFWLPGQWEYANGQYQWRGGYWTKHHEGWVWQPACYISAPQGFLYVDGYWDALPPHRGLPYATVEFPGSIIQQPGYMYHPQYPLANDSTILLHLFTRPGCPHYYYGDYYGDHHVAQGYRPWYDSGFSAGVPPSLNSLWLGYYDWNYRRSGIDFTGSMQRYNEFYKANPQQRPPKQFKQSQLSKSNSIFLNTVPSFKAGKSNFSLDELIQSQVGGKPLKHINEKINGRSSAFNLPQQLNPQQRPLQAISDQKGKDIKSATINSEMVFKDFRPAAIANDKGVKEFKPATTINEKGIKDFRAPLIEKGFKDVKSPKLKLDALPEWGREKGGGNSGAKSPKQSGGKGDGKKK
jgi:WXXGXW repeat (2 copies)